MEQILSLMTFLGAFTFIGMGLYIEAKESEKTTNRMIVIIILGIASFLIGFFGLLIS